MSSDTAAGDDIMFLIRSLDIGGTERQLVTLAVELHRRGRRVCVATFYSGGELANELHEAAVPVVSLRKESRWDVIRFGVRLVKLVRRHRPTVLHSYLPNPNVFAALLRPLFPRLLLVWGIRVSHMDLSRYDWTARLSYRIADLLAGAADVIVVNSRAGAAHQRARGLPFARMYVVPNGVDVMRFRPDQAARAAIRRELGFSDTDPVIGIVARIDPMKDHDTFLAAAAAFICERPEARFVCIGSGSDLAVRALREKAVDLGISGHVVWCGVRHDMAAVYNAMDVVALTSVTEGFPNAVAEAMACGVPCAVTDVGDCAWIVGDSGAVVPVKDPGAMARAWASLLAKDSRPTAAVVRARVVEEFAVNRMVERMEHLLWPA